MPDRLHIGAHLSTAAGLAAVCRTAVEIGASCAQIFTSSPQQWRAKSYAQADIEAFHAAQAETGVTPVVAHESYLINLASSDPALLEKSRDAFDEELRRCGQLGLPAVVLHWGSYKGGTLDEGLDRLAESLTRCLPLADDLGVQMLLETTAGQGAYLGGDFGQYPRLFDRIPAHEKLGACLDLCHIFVAGYDMRDPVGYAAVWDDFDRTVGIHRLHALHMNDTEKALGSHGDRHANLGTGNLGTEIYRLLMHDPRLTDVPKILETPNGLEALAADLRTLREAAV